MGDVCCGVFGYVSDFTNSINYIIIVKTKMNFPNSDRLSKLVLMKKYLVFTLVLIDFLSFFMLLVAM